jgi:hypothetical protein
VIGAISDIVAAAPIAFFIGVFVGFVLSNRYRLVKRPDNGTAQGEPQGTTYQRSDRR